MDDKTAMTVEFLRARLLSERTVSRTARERAEMLAQRVMELEEQIRIVKIQRKKAERATEEVLSILDTQGITYISGLTDSSTDKEENQSTLSEDAKEDEFLAASGMDRSEVDDGSSRSDIDGCPSDYRSLSWKSHGSKLNSQGKQKIKQIRHRQGSSFIISVKSSQTHPGKSCRKIKIRDVGSASENELQKPALLDVHGNGMIDWPKIFDEKHNLPLEASESKMENFSVDSQLSSGHDDQNREFKDLRSGNDDGMERALEQQAQLIGQFRAMENAQREWEEKFNETKISLLDNHEPVNQVSVAENSNRPSDNSKLVNRIQLLEDEKLSVIDVPFTEDTMDGRCRNCEMTHENEVAIDKFSPGLMPTSPSSSSRNDSNDCTNGLLNQQCESTAINEMETVSSALKFPPQDNPDVTRKEHLGPNFEKSNNGLLSNLKVHQHEQGMIFHYSSKELNAQDNKKNLYGLPEIQQEHLRHLSQAHGLMKEQFDTMTVNESKYTSQVYKFQPQDSPGLVASRKDLQGPIYEKPNTSFHSSAKRKPHEQEMLENSSTQQHAPTNHEKISYRELPEGKELPRQLFHATSSSLGSVLQSLQRAKVSIREELAKQPSSNEGTLSIAASANSPMKFIPFCKTVDIPVGHSGLFNLPTDSFPQTQLSGSNVYGSGLRLTATRPDVGLMTSTISTGKEYFVQSPSASYIQGRSRVSVGRDYADRNAFKPYNEDVPRVQVRKEYMNHFPARRYLEAGSQVSTIKDYFDRHSSSSISASSANDYPFYYPGLSTRMPTLRNELPNSSSDFRNGMPFSSRYSYGGDTLSNLHRL